MHTTTPKTDCSHAQSSATPSIAVARAPVARYDEQDRGYPTCGVLDFSIDLRGAAPMDFKRIAANAAAIGMAIQSVTERDMPGAKLSISTRSSMDHRFCEGTADWLAHLLLREVERHVAELQSQRASCQSFQCPSCLAQSPAPLAPAPDTSSKTLAG